MLITTVANDGATLNCAALIPAASSAVVKLDLFLKQEMIIFRFISRHDVTPASDQ